MPDPFSIDLIQHVEGEFVTGLAIGTSGLADRRGGFCLQMRFEKTAYWECKSQKLCGDGKKELACENLAKASAAAETGAQPKRRGPKHLKKGVE